jgi:spore coat polysaccharide biosynthesis protein SpsF (cytidylyltransferase family)
VATRATVERAADRALSTRDREHVFTYVTSHPEEFDVRFSEAPPALKRPELRVCVDEPADLEVVRRILDELDAGGRSVSTAEVIDVLDHHPDIRAINQSVRQRS